MLAWSWGNSSCLATAWIPYLNPHPKQIHLAWRGSVRNGMLFFFLSRRKKAAMFTCKKVNQDGDSMHTIGSTYSKSRVAPILYRPFTKSPHHTVDVDIFPLTMLFSLSQLIEWSWSYFTSRFLKCWASFWGCHAKILSYYQVSKEKNATPQKLKVQHSLLELRLMCVIPSEWLLVRLSLRRVFFETSFWVIYLYVNKSYSEILKSLDNLFKEGWGKGSNLHDTGFYSGEALRL